MFRKSSFVLNDSENEEKHVKVCFDFKSEWKIINVSSSLIISAMIKKFAKVIKKLLRSSSYQNSCLKHMLFLWRSFLVLYFLEYLASIYALNLADFRSWIYHSILLFVATVENCGFQQQTFLNNIFYQFDIDRRNG